MPTKKRNAAAAAGDSFDPRSERVVLEYRGSEDGVPALGGIPARDLTEADLCRLVYARALNDYDGSPASPPLPDPDRPSQAKVRELVGLLLERRVDGKAVYSVAKPKAEPDPPAADVQEQPAAPAQPEV